MAPTTRSVAPPQGRRGRRKRRRPFSPGPFSPRLTAARVAADKAGRLQRWRLRGSSSPSPWCSGWGTARPDDGSTAPASTPGSSASEPGSGLGRVAARGPRGGSGDGVWPTRRAAQRASSSASVVAVAVQIHADGILWGGSWRRG